MDIHWCFTLTSLRLQELSVSVLFDHLQHIRDRIEEYADSEERKISGSILFLAIQAVYQCLRLCDNLFNGIQFGSKEQGVIHIRYENHTAPIVHPGINIRDFEVNIIESSLEMVIPGQWSL